MLRWYNLENYKPWWYNEGSAFPDFHIEAVVKKVPQLYSWTEINPKINWTPDDISVATLNSSKDTAPDYLKATDNQTTYYFYKVSMTPNAVQTGRINYTYTYQLDMFMTIYWNKLDILKGLNPNVKFIRKFTDRCRYNYNGETLENIEIDYIKQKELGNHVPIKNYQFVRKYLYGTNELALWHNNYSDIERPSEVSFKNWFNDNTVSKAFNYFTELNSNNRYTYIICKSSAKQKGKLNTSSTVNSQIYGDNTKLIIPLDKQSANDIIKSFITIDITKEQTGCINALSDGNFIGIFDCDIPPSLFYGLSVKDPENCKRIAGYNQCVNNFNYNPVAFEIPVNYAPLWTIINFSEYENGFDGKFKHIIDNLLTIDTTTEPLLLNPTLYQERTTIDNDKYISSDTSLLTYTREPIVNTKGINIKAYCLFDNTLLISYQYGDYNNKLNPLWNNKYSNVRNDIGSQVGVYGSAAATYYAQNANTAITSIYTRKNEQTQQWVDTGFNLANSTVDYGAGIFKSFFKGDMISAGTDIIFGPFKLFSKFFTSIFNTVNENKRKNAEVNMRINNINSSPSFTLGNPFIDSGIPNQNIEGNTLFNTWSNELHDWDKILVLNDILQNGYWYNYTDNFNSYDNRKYMNILYIDTTYKYDYLLRLLKEYDKTTFNANTYIVDFLNWLNNIHQLYKTLYPLNVTDMQGITYISNVERFLPYNPQGIKDIQSTIPSNITVAIDENKLASLCMKPLLEVFGNTQYEADWEKYNYYINGNVINVSAKPEYENDYIGSGVINVEYKTLPPGGSLFGLFGDTKQWELITGSRDLTTLKIVFWTGTTQSRPTIVEPNDYYWVENYKKTINEFNPTNNAQIIGIIYDGSNNRKVNYLDPQDTIYCEQIGNSFTGNEKIKYIYPITNNNVNIYNSFNNSKITKMNIYTDTDLSIKDSFNNTNINDLYINLNVKNPWVTGSGTGNIINSFKELPDNTLITIRYDYYYSLKFETNSFTSNNEKTYTIFFGFSFTNVGAAMCSSDNTSLIGTPLTVNIRNSDTWTLNNLPNIEGKRIVNYV